MLQKKWTLATLLLVASSTQATVSNHYFIGLQFDAAYNQIRHNELVTAPVPGSDPQRYNTNGGDKYEFEAGLRTGFTTILNPHWALQWGLAYYIDLPQKLTGDYFALNSSPPDLTYRTKLHTQRLMIEPRAYYQQNNHWAYFAGVNLGLAILRTSKTQFSTIAYPSGSTTPLDATAKTDTAFAYGVSVGIDYQFNPHWHAALGVSQLWLGKIDIRVNNGSSNVPVKVGTSKPTQLWIASRYQF
jgi:opacity protein-like surface antigen